MSNVDSMAAAPSSRTFPPAIGRWIGGLFLIASCAIVVSHFFGSLYTQGIDLSLHYALVARIAERGPLPITGDPSLGELNFYPRYAHRLGAIVGNLFGSPLMGMQMIAVLSLAVLWAGFGFIFLSLPRRLLWWAAGGLAILFVLNRFWIHAEIFGYEVVINYYYPQLVAQAIAIGTLAAALWLERAQRSPIPSYLVLGAAAPLLPQFHLLPAVEVLASGFLLVAANAVAGWGERRRSVLLFGPLIMLASLILMVLSPGFRTMVGLSENNGLLLLRYIPDLTSLVVLCVVVVAVSVLLLWHWLKMGEEATRLNAQALKYVGAFGLAAAGLCLTQIVMLKLGYGSEYACRKYAFALITSLLLDLPLVGLTSIRRLRAGFASGASAPTGMTATLARSLFAGAFVLGSCFAVLPSPSDRVGAVADIEQAERFAVEYRAPFGADRSTRYDYALGIHGKDRGYDYLITIGVLRTPRGHDAEEFLFEKPLSQPRKVGRIFTTVGSSPWDIPECRQLVTPDGFVILDGQCVLAQVHTPQD
jgi:hypothetical protein